MRPEVEDRLLLKLLAMDYEGSISQDSISALVLERIKELELVRNTVLNNITTGKLATLVLVTHYKLCAELGFKECMESLYLTIRDNDVLSTYDRIKLTECYLKLGGEITDFENNLTIPDLDANSRYSSWQWFLLEKMLFLRTEKVSIVLVNILNSDHKLYDKMIAAQYLVQLSNSEGLIFWSSNIVIDDQIDVHAKWEPMLEGVCKMLETTSIPLLISCLAGKRSLGGRDMRYYEEFVFASLLAIAKLKYENFVLIRTEFFKLAQREVENADHLNWLTDRLDKEYHESQTQEMEIDAANTFYEKYFTHN
jgi:hypothetical protein